MCWKCSFGNRLGDDALVVPGIGTVGYLYFVT